MPRLGMKVSLHTEGLLPGAPTLTGVGLAPTEEAQRVTIAPAKIAVPALVTSRRTMRLRYRGPHEIARLIARFHLIGHGERNFVGWF
jgi:hypothetical protein